MLSIYIYSSVCVAVDGYRLVYERKIKFDLHLIDPEVPDRVLEEVNRLEDMIVKILVRVSVQASNLLINSKYRETKTTIQQ